MCDAYNVVYMYTHIKRDRERNSVFYLIAVSVINTFPHVLKQISVM